MCKTWVLFLVCNVVPKRVSGIGIKWVVKVFFFSWNDWRGSVDFVLHELCNVKVIFDSVKESFVIDNKKYCVEFCFFLNLFLLTLSTMKKSFRTFIFYSLIVLFSCNFLDQFLYIFFNCLLLRFRKVECKQRSYTVQFV